MTKDWRNALPQIDAALRVTPGEPRLLFRRAQCLMALGSRGEAVAAADSALAAANPNALLVDAIGSFFSFIGDQRRALTAFERAVALAPDNAHVIFNRATVRRFFGELAAAESDYDRVIALRPTDFEAYKNRSDLRSQTVESNHVAELEALAGQPFGDWRGEVHVRHALAKEYEDLGEYAKSFEQLRRGAAKRRESIDYDVTKDTATVQWIIDAFPGAVPTGAVPTGAVPSSPTRGGPMRGAPIFIVGLPRSGTTLVDRILSSHSEVTAAGELNDFAHVLTAHVTAGNGMQRLPRRDMVARSAQIDFASLGRDYLERAHAVAGPGRFTDKMPLNYLYCGLIVRAIPDARIVHLTRHPMAAGYAMYKTLFKDGYPFSYDLEEIAQYYIAYRRLMEHWYATLPGAIHSVRYESLVADQGAETRSLLDYCGLDWQDSCVDFHRNAAPTTTASAAQIRRPIYDSSVAQWRHYAAQLQLLRDRLTEAGIDL